MRSHIESTIKMKKAWLPLMGAALLGILAFNLSLEGAGVPSPESERDRAISQGSDELDQARTFSSRLAHRNATKAAASGSFRVGTLPQREYPIGPVYQVNPHDDIGSRGRREGKWVGAMPAPNAGVGVIAAGPGGGSCSFAIDCDDNDLCTTDSCDIAPGGGEGSGTCVNTPVADGQPGDCDDGIFCNGEETCSGNTVVLCEGECAGGPNAGESCQTSASNVGCPESFCDNQGCGGVGGTACTYTQECSTGGGVCVPAGNPCSGGDFCNEQTAQRLSLTDPPASLDSDNYCEDCGANDLNPGNACDDGLQCNGLETCQSNICVAGSRPCGAAGNCNEFQCAQSAGCTIPNGCAFAPCVSDLDCLGIVGACQATTPGGGVNRDGCFDGRCCDGLTCTKAQFVNCAFDWYATDNGRLIPTAACPGCPLYSAGIGDQGDFTVVAGPASLSPADEIMSGDPLRKIGDDYNFCGSGDYMSLENLRFVGGSGTLGNSRISFEFYDANGTFVEDLFFISNSFPSTITVQLVEFLEPIDIPCEGFIVAHILQAFAGNVNDKGEMFWVATDGVDEGSNITNKLYTDIDLDWTPASPPQQVDNFLKRCSGGFDDGKPCNTGPDCLSNTCEARGNDVLAFELEGDIVPAPLGICCADGTPGCNKLTQWDCEAVDGQFLGIGGTCYSCDLASSNPGDPCETCTGGANDGLFCDSDIDCPGGACDPDNAECLGGGTCAVNDACSVGACCIDATGECVEGVDESTCTGLTGTFLGFGTDCDPNCCPQPLAFWTGRDNCEDAGAVASIITVPCASDADCGNNPDSGRCNVSTGECVVTITGDNSGASSIPLTCNGGANDGASCLSGAECPGGTCDGNPDSCNPPSPTPGGELGYWEAFSITDCGYVRLDHCCTEPVKIPAYRVLYDSCPCGSAIFTKRDPNVAEEPPDSRGDPYCTLDNAWNKFGPLAQGTYYYPVLSFLGGNFDEYQLHVTVKPCPNAACCYSACSNSSDTVCTTDNDCAPGESCVVQDGGGSPSLCKNICDQDADCGAGTCDPLCSLMNILECQGIGGAFLAPPNRSTAVVTCAGNICDTGSCCTGPGECEDEILGVAITKADCTNVFDGKYVGGFECFGGTCSGGPRDGLSCAVQSQCDPGGACVGDPVDIAQPSPCPVCEIAAGDNCQFWDDSVGERSSDATQPGGARTADDFIPDSDVINTVCVWGNYIEPDALGNALDCSSTSGDAFVVSVFYPDSNGVADITNVAGTSTVTGANVAKATIPSANEDLGNGVGIVYAYQLTLDTPINLEAGDPADQIYWLEVRNDTSVPSGNNCLWSWMAVDTVYNDYSCAGAEGGYAGLRTTDFAFCIDSNFRAPDPYLRQCCDCAEACTLKTKRDCDNALSSFDVGNDACAICNDLPPLNDNCLAIINDAPLNGLTHTIEFDNHCTSTDGPNPTPTELTPGGETAVNDVWYLYEAPVDGVVTISSCPTGNADGGGIDTMLAVYTLDCNAPTCPNQADHLGRLVGGLAPDENCNGIRDGGGAFVETTASAGDCFLVRVAGFGGQGSEQGQGVVTFETGAPPSVDDPTASSDGDKKSRWLGISPWVSAAAGGDPSTIKVELVDIHDALGQDAREGEIWWAKPPVVQVPNTPNPSIPAAQLECTATPTSAVWPAGDLHLYGIAVVPGSTYRVFTCTSDGSECSTPGLLVESAKWGDVKAPFFPASPNEPSFIDISACVDKFKQFNFAPDMVYTDLGAAGTEAVDFQTNFADIGSDVDAFKSVLYPTGPAYAIPTCSP